MAKDPKVLMDRIDRIKPRPERYAMFLDWIDLGSIDDASEHARFKLLKNIKF